MQTGWILVVNDPLPGLYFCDWIMIKAGTVHIYGILSKTLRGGYLSPVLWTRNLPKVSHIMVETESRPKSV